MAEEVPVPDPNVVPVLEVQVAGRFLGLGRSSAYEAVRAGDIPSIKIGRRVVVPTAALRRMLCLDVPNDDRGVA